MCGIWLSVWNAAGNPSGNTRRGPDHTTIVNNPEFKMVFDRLAIHDLSDHANQPFTEELGNGWKFVYQCNGEIYNYKEIIAKYRFVMETGSDCEVIGKLFIAYRDIRNVVAELDGEYAITGVLLHDEKIEEVIIARDPFGVRPLYWATNGHGYVFSSLLVGISIPNAEHVPPGDTWTIKKNHTQFSSYFVKDWPNPILPTHTEQLYTRVTSTLIAAIHKRLSSDRPIGFLLSGGLDSSLVVALAVQMIGKEKVKTFSIGMPGGTDLLYAKKVADYLGTQHTEVLFTAQEGIAAIPEVVRATETYDITTIRASVGQYLLAKYISEHTDIKVILNGDGADEAEMGYLYFYNHPSEDEADQESICLLREIHQFDGLRVDRCLGAHGLEARVPFLDPAFVEAMLAVPTDLRIPTSTRMEKQFLRDAFWNLTPTLLPHEIMYRKKEAFSDGVSKSTESWFQILQNSIRWPIKTVPHIQPTTCEAAYYRALFDLYFPEQHTILSHYWMPKWSDTTDPSARTLALGTSSTHPSPPSPSA
jgi:asparagine synthase (glutamine-hydrolysing)